VPSWIGNFGFRAKVTPWDIESTIYVLEDAKSVKKYIGDVGAP
jgi:hypothetical protein